MTERQFETCNKSINLIQKLALISSATILRKVKWRREEKTEFCVVSLETCCCLAPMYD